VNVTHPYLSTTQKNLKKIKICGNAHHYLRYKMMLNSGGIDDPDHQNENENMMMMSFQHFGDE